MTEPSLQDIRDFNSDLRTIQAAGVPLYFDSPTKPGGTSAKIDFSSNESLTESLFAIEASLASAVSSGMQLSAALEQSSLISSNYRQSLLLWHRTNRSPIAFDTLTLAAQAKRRQWSRQAINLVQPLIAITLAYCCLVFICGLVAPLYQSLNQQAQAAQGPFLTVLLWLRAWMPLWLIAIPVAILFLASRPWYAWKQAIGRRRFNDPERSWEAQADTAGRARVSAFANELIANGHSNSATIQWVQSTIGSQLQGPESANATEKTPALMAWAIDDPAPDSPSSRIGTRLRLAADIYSASADALASRGRKLIQPRIKYILFGGLLTMAVSLLVFGPLIETMLFVLVSDRSWVE